jgi:type I restriction enzyme, S subunit
MTADPPPGWSFAALEELASPGNRSITDGPFGSNLKTAHYTQSGPRVVRLQNIGDGRFIDVAAHISQERFELLRAHEVAGGDVVVAALGEVLPRACVVPDWLGSAIVKADCARIRLHPEVNAAFVVAMLNSPAIRAQAADQISGVGRPRISLAKTRKLQLPVPPASEQKRIVGAIDEQFSRLDSALLLIQAGLQRLPLIRRAVLDQVMPHPLPEGWKLLTVDEAGTVDLGRQRSPQYHSGPNMKPYLRVANVHEDRIDLADVKEMDFPTHQRPRYELRAGDILLNEGNGSPELVGSPAMYRGELSGVCFTNSLIRFRPFDFVDGEYALLVFLRHLRFGRFQTSAQITTIAHLAAGRFKKIEFPVPPLGVQRDIIQEVRRHLSLLSAFESELRLALKRSGTLRAAILAAAFRGELVAQDPSDEPAAKFLARISADRSAAAQGKRKKNGV